MSKRSAEVALGGTSSEDDDGIAGAFPVDVLKKQLRDVLADGSGGGVSSGGSGGGSGISEGVPVYLASVLQLVTSRIISRAMEGQQSQGDDKAHQSSDRNRITPKELLAALNAVA